MHDNDLDLSWNHNYLFWMLINLNEDSPHWGDREDHEEENFEMAEEGCKEGRKNQMFCKDVYS